LSIRRARGGDRRADIAFDAHDFTAAGVEHVQATRRVELHRGRCCESGRDRRQLAGRDVDLDDLAAKPTRSVELAIRAPVHAVQAAPRPAVVTDHAGLGPPVRIDLVELVAHEALRDEEAPVICECDRIDAPTEPRRRNGFACGCPTDHVAVEDVGPAQRAVGTEGEIVGIARALIGSESRDDAPIVRAQYEDAGADHARDVEVAVRPDLNSVGTVDQAARCEDLHRGVGLQRRW
jgi:hypothetical protein